MAGLLSRPLSVRFSTFQLRGLTHIDVLEALEENIEKEKIKSIQIKEKECVVTVADQETKTKLILSATNLKNRSVVVNGVDNIITNVTIKDAPYEMPDNVVIECMSRYGDIMSGSYVRGKIKGTNIENGTRYVKILNCVPILPLHKAIGRFKIRIFADNNRTPCKLCGETNHPYFKCPSKLTRVPEESERDQK